MSAAPAAAPAAPKASGGNGVAIKAPLPATVMKIVVEVGEKVEAGATVMVVEAMKMETEIKAANAGTIADILVEVGNVVAAGDTLAVIEE